MIAYPMISSVSLFSSVVCIYIYMLPPLDWLSRLALGDVGGVDGERGAVVGVSDADTTMSRDASDVLVKLEPGLEADASMHREREGGPSMEVEGLGADQASRGHSRLPMGVHPICPTIPPFSAYIPFKEVRASP
ncbi:hypothetical protein KIPB_011439 [Kipferlia bialata]|uniref:Uncharacterized protein n=1 Tax=Kipferlia bialata TaxID=797122 RepID=A0A391NQ96_9EUKA|nr:hypothetical protein KIPB_011439 [Kipferlia bialata]|eukprot:g11439.t1